MLVSRAFFSQGGDFDTFVVHSNNEYVHGFDHSSVECGFWLSCETVITIMIYRAHHALNKLLVVGGNGFIGLPFLQPCAPE